MAARHTGMPEPLPERFRQNVTGVFGPEGARWLARLPEVIAEAAERWGLTVGPPYALSFNYVAPAERADGEAAVLKLGVPCRELATEVAALRHYDGHGAAHLIEADPDAGALLIERAEPGTMLAGLCETDDSAATTAAAQVMRALWRPAPRVHAFPTVADWAAGLKRLRARFGGGTGPLPAPLVERAEGLFADLLASQAPPVLLHGDLHHENILAARRAPWLAIDPKGVVGEPAYECGALLRNPWDWIPRQPDLPRLLTHRIDQLAAELSLDAERIRGWALAQAVLSAWWSIEDTGSGWEQAVAVAEALKDHHGGTEAQRKTD